ncbi:MAG: hypothetical protein VX874_09860 [Pseudomonadota bacterium]|nr:hypothetical protein [Pseudomonadota bacterium]
MISRTILTTGLGLFTATALSGCLTSTTNPDLAQLINDSITGIEALGTAQPSPMPTSSSATYTGAAIMQVGADNFDDVQRVFGGVANLQANFTSAGGSVSGEITNIVGAENVSTSALNTAIYSGSVEQIEDIVGAFTPATGSLDITDGVITGSTYRANISGEFEHEGDTFAYGGDGGGYFQGTDAEGMKFYGDTRIDSEGKQMTVTENGASRQGMVYVNALAD